MTPPAQLWLAFARNDLKSAELLLKESDLYGPAIFHCQQSAEKCLKAILEQCRQPIPRSHDLERLFALIPSDSRPDLDADNLALLTSFYLDSRYPPFFALANGQPSESTARSLLEFAQHIESITAALIDSTS